MLQLSILCLLTQLSAEQCLGGCFRDVLMKAKTDIKEGIKQAPLCGYSAMNDLFRFGCLRRCQLQCDRDRLITADSASTLRTTAFTWAREQVSFCHTCVLHLHLIDATLRETLNKSGT